MNKKLFLFLFMLLLSRNAVFADGLPQVTPFAPSPAVTPVTSNSVIIVQPVENAKLPALATTYVCGSAPPDGQLTINGQPVPIHSGGGFVTMVALTPGKFTINAKWTKDGVCIRTVRVIEVAAPEPPIPATPLTIGYVTPRRDLKLQVGDPVRVVCKGSPGMRGYFTVGGVRGKFSLLETVPGVTGVYQGVYLVRAKDRLRQSRLKVTLVDSRHKQVTREAAGSLSLFPQALPVIARVIGENAVLRAGPALGPYDKGGYLIFPPEGTLLRLTGKRGNEYRVRLNDSVVVWANADQVELLPEGTAAPRAVVGNLTLGRVDNLVRLRLPLRCQIPFMVEADSDGRYLELTLFGAYSNTDRIANGAPELVRQVRWFQDDRETYRLRLDTMTDSWWGYDVRYEGRNLVLELRLPPPRVAGSDSLAGLKVAVDAGHGAGGGAPGLFGESEGDVNLAMAALLREKLLAKGAQVILTRPGAVDTPLLDRTKIAREQRVDLLISVHNNSLGPGGNPLLKHGFEIYYFTPMSVALAREIYDAYRAGFGTGKQYDLPDGGLFYGNLALTRPTQMPAVLVESAYMIYPAEAAYLQTAEFRSACAAAMLEGIERYVLRMRPVVDPPSSPATAPTTSVQPAAGS
jgi:N-acetylmuramoyl-L-alanine amidase